MRKVGTIEAHSAAQNRPYANENAGKARFAGGARTDNADYLARLQVEGYPFENYGIIGAGRCGDQIGDLQRALRTRKGHSFRLGASNRE